MSANQSQIASSAVNRAEAVESPEPSGSKPKPTEVGVLRFFLLIAGITFLLRILYAGHLYEDDGLWFSAAEELLRGRALYREIYLDKPPGIVFLYAGLFKLFGTKIIVIRLFTILYSLAVSAVLYAFGKKLYDTRTGILSAAIFALFSTTAATGHVQALNTDFLAVLPYVAASYLIAGAALSVSPALARGRVLWIGFAAGALTGLGFQINPKAVFALLFLFLLTLRLRKQAALLIAAAVAGFAAGNVPFIVYITAVDSWPHYQSYVWEWGSRYAAYHSLGATIMKGIARTLGYLSLNNTLLIALVFLCFTMVRKGLRHCSRADRLFESDSILLIWLVASYLGVALGGRFYDHYFLQILPPLSLVGARGLQEIAIALKSRPKLVRRSAMGVIALGFLFTLIRFHGRTAFLISDWVRGSKSEMTAGWYSDMLNREERLVAAVVRDLPDEQASEAEADTIRAWGPRSRGIRGPEDHLFVWGYRPEIYYWSGLIPASRYLSTQPLTGVPADVHYINGEDRSILPEELTAAARAELIRDLNETRPKYIIDELGFFNSALSIDRYPELVEFLKEYRNLGATARFFVYRRRDLAWKRQPPTTSSPPGR